MATYTTIQHPKSGETYAVELDGDGEIIRAAGPMYYSDPTDAASLSGWIAQDYDAADEDGAWLRDELAKAGR